MDSWDELFKTIEEAADITVEDILYSKIDKVMKMIAALDSVARNEELKITERADKLYNDVSGRRCDALLPSLTRRSGQRSRSRPSLGPSPRPTARPRRRLLMRTRPLLLPPSRRLKPLRPHPRLPTTSPRLRPRYRTVRESRPARGAGHVCANKH
ncbi:hypothetical protein VHUM_02381 [Vanrija humicola]|uniref:Uncharacterized protein n=1 Tax=Vanrija humicola TaxID=5417 RepID=A0A7D8Z0C7_VANHU|nr:hypothetical protein VHUM_02381 [Vanrija humicola]